MTASTTEYALRPDLDMTLGTLRDIKREQRRGVESNDFDMGDVQVNYDAANPNIQIGRETVPMTDTGLIALSDALGIPSPYFKRLGEEYGGMSAQGRLLDIHLDMAGGAYRAEIGDQGLVSVRGVDGLDLNAVDLLNVAIETLDSYLAPVQRLTESGGVLEFDAHVPLSDARGLIGDDTEVETPEGLTGYSWTSGSPLSGASRINDLTAIGLRYRFDMKKNMVPTITPWSMRLVCTNGMESTTTLARIDGRGADTSREAVMDHLRQTGMDALANLRSEVSHYYSMKDNAISNVERRIRAVSSESGLSDRTSARLLDAMTARLGDSSNEFEFVSELTNFANRTRSVGVARQLEQAGGAVISIDHSLRCTQCDTVMVGPR